MPNRIIKESICASETIDSLSWFDEVVFYRLVVNCDDYGRFDGRSSILNSRLFPLKKNITDKTVADAINKLSTAGLVMPYSFDGKPILQLVTWDKHQSVRNKKSKYPAINGSDTASASENVQMISKADNCMQLQSIDCNCHRNPIQSNPSCSSGGYNAPVDEEWAEIYQLYTENIQPSPSPIEIEELQAIYDETDHILIRHAVKVAVLKNERFLGYVKGVLKRLADNNVKTAGDLEAYNRDWERRTRGSKSSQPVDIRKFVKPTEREYSKEFYDSLSVDLSQFKTQTGDVGT